MQQEEGARPGRGIYIFFMILFNLPRLAAERFPSQVLLGGGCAQKADRVSCCHSCPQALSQCQPGALGDPYVGRKTASLALSPKCCNQKRPEAQP